MAARWTGNSRLLQGPTLEEGSVPRGKAAFLPLKRLLAVPRCNGGGGGGQQSEGKGLAAGYACKF